MPERKKCPVCGDTLKTAYVRFGTHGRYWEKVGYYCRKCKTVINF